MSERSDLDARYNQHLINGYTSQQAWDMATSELGTKSSHFTIGSDGEVETTSLYDTEQANIKAKQKEYDAW